MIKHLSRIFLLLLAGCIIMVKASAQNAEIPSLEDIFKNDFLMGAAVNATQIEERDLKADRLIKQQFNAVTPENVMKAEIIHPEWDVYHFDLADKLVACILQRHRNSQ